MKGETKKAKPRLSKEERKAKYTDLARKKAAKERERVVGSRSICFQCRQRGHTVLHCPNKAVSSNCCYKCGSPEHSLATCPRRGVAVSGDEELPFATCFVCNEIGHLAVRCPNNSNGIYVNGGCCRECGSNQHRVTECPNKKKKVRRTTADTGIEGDASDEYHDLLEDEQSNRRKKASISDEAQMPSKLKRRIVKF